MTIALDPPPAADALTRDSELLSQVLHEVLVEQNGEALAREVRGLHETAAELRAGDAAAQARLAERIASLPDDHIEPVIRACALQLQLANIAEQRERVRRRRHYDATGVRQRESLLEAAELLRADGADLAAAVRALHVELVLTAHPTEATRRSVLDHQLRIAGLLDGLDDPRIGRTRRRELLAELRESLTLWWLTDEVRRVRPKVEDEVRRNLFFFEATLHETVPLVLDELERAFDVRVDGRALSFGSWAGSDMDGHPEVGAEVLARTLFLHRRAALRLLRAGVDRLAARFSHSRRRVTVSPALEASLARDEAELPSAPVLRRVHREWEPLRTKLGFVAHRLYNMLDPLAREPGYADPQELRDDLWLVLDSVGSEHVAHGAIRRLLRQVDVFGFHAASLDVRQSAAVVQEAVAALLPGYRAADEAERRRLLLEAVAEGRRGLDRHPEGPAGELLRVLDTAAMAREAYGPRAVPVMVISMVQAPSDVLAALWLSRRARARGCGSCRSSRRSPTSSTRRPRWPRCTRARSTATRCATRATGRRSCSATRTRARTRASSPASGRCTSRRRSSPRRRRSTGSSWSSSTAAAGRPRAAAGAPTRPSSPSRAAPCTAASASRSRARRCPRATATPSWRRARWSRRCPPCCSPPRASARRFPRPGGRRWSA